MEYKIDTKESMDDFISGLNDGSIKIIKQVGNVITATLNNERTTFEVIDELYKQNGYKRPNIVFWNVNASGSNLPVRAHETGATLVSGFSPVVFKMAVENKTPMQVMLDTINAPRYAQIEI